jgi:transcriptional regulator with XRE-family HTH domain
LKNGAAFRRNLSHKILDKGQVISYFGEMGTKPFSEQLREAIAASGASHYALARAVEISESALSRFVSGKRGLTLASLDKLAEVLGLILVVGVQNVPRPVPKGRKPRKTKMTNRGIASRGETMNRWAQEFAFKCAWDACENHFPSRRGVWIFEDEGILCLFNNNPYAHMPTRRDEELAEFRRRMKVEGIQEVAYATYPPEGEEDAGYTYALLIKAGADKAEWAAETMTQIIVDFVARDVAKGKASK